MKSIVELVQLFLILGYTLTTWGRERWASKIVCAWWSGVLMIDLFIWRGNRPIYVKEFLNCFDVGIGLVFIYAKFKNPCKHYVKHLIAFVCGLFM
jgi:hypothetical protein